MNAQLFDPAVKPETNAQRKARETAERGNMPATEAQIRYLQGLRSYKDIGAMGEIPADLTKAKASEAIEWLKARADKPRETRAAFYAAGLYLYGDKVFRIVPGTGKYADWTYANELIETAEGGALWKFVPGMDVPALTRMTAEQATTYAERFARAHHQCIMCSRTITTKASIARAMGPTCAGRVA